MGFYSDSVEVVHADEANYGNLKTRSSPNFVMSSEIRQFDATIKPVGLGIKYVSDGEESYYIGGKCVQILTGNYLLINDSIPSVDVLIKNRLTQGVCVDIDPMLVNDVLYQILKPDDLESYENTKKYLLSPDLLIRQAKGSTYFRNLLNSFLYSEESLNKQPRAVELIYELTGTLIRENLDLIRSCYRITAAKPSTRKELFSKLLRGRDMLNDSMYNKMTVKDVARECSISEFRFFRLFRQCFGMSPYDYYLKEKIRKSVELRRQGLSWSEISYTLNFSDPAAFNRAFKKIYNSSPSIAERNF